MNHKRFEALYELYYDSFLSFANILLENPHDAEDAVHDAFLTYMENNSLLTPRSKRTISLYETFSLILSARIEQKAYSFTYSTSAAYKIDEPKDIFLHHIAQEYSRIRSKLQLQDSLKEAIKQLPKSDRQILHLFYEYQLSSKEIGTLLSLTHTAIRKRMQRSIQKLRIAMDCE